MASDYKDTLNLPRTDLPMRASLSQREPERLARWRKEGLYARLREARAGERRWVLHDGPPYANGHIHLGTALNKILKDMVVRFRALEGHDTPFVPGWDCHGMPIEHNVVREMGEEARTADAAQIRKACREYAASFVEVQREEFQRLGCIGDWEHPYLTMSHGYEAAIVRALGALASAGYLYRGLRPIHWCATCRTALAEAEVEYGPHRSPAVTVRFPLEDGWRKDRPELEGIAEASILIWTTTPWTLPANLAVAVDEGFDYAWYRVGKEAWLLADRLAPLVLEAAGREGERLRTEPGAGLLGLSYRSPLNGRECPILLGEHVTLEQGTGCVHTAPGHGHEDFELGRSAGLEILNPVGPDGRFTEEAGTWQGRHVFESNGPITEHLREEGFLVHDEQVEHSYPHCWRCHEPVLFRATEQWFMSVDHDGLRSRALEAIEETTWVPRWGYERIRNMVDQRPDWCLSRQRSWGVPIPAFHCEACGEDALVPDWIERFAVLVEEGGSDVWYELSAEELLPEGAGCPGCGASELVKHSDILDVWFDASCSHLAVLAGAEDLAWPAQLYLEATDQHRGWFQGSLLNALATQKAPPFESVLTHGLILDESSKKMSKSLGNVIAPEEILQDLGADILRLAYASVDFTGDVPFSRERTLEPATESYRRIRNTCRFLLGNLAGFDPRTDLVPFDRLQPIDRHSLAVLRRVVEGCLEDYRSYAFHKVVHRLVNHCAGELSSFYLDILKDRLYCETSDGELRRSAQTVLHHQLGWIVRLLLPVCPFTAEEVWEQRTREDGDPDWALLSVFPSTQDLPEESSEEERAWSRLREVREQVLAALEEARAAKRIGKPLEASVSLGPSSALRPLLERSPVDLADFFIVSEVVLEDEEPPEGDLTVEVHRAEAEKCPRCWKHTAETASEPCPRCRGVLESGA